MKILPTALPLIVALLLPLFVFVVPVDAVAVTPAVTSTSTSTMPIATAPKTSAFWIGIYGIFQALLWVKIMTVRVPMLQGSPSTLDVRKLKDSTDERNLCATRAYGNFAESAPIFAVMLLVIDLCNVVPKLWIDSLGLAFTFGRAMHAVGLLSNPGETIGRVFGAFFTLSSLFVGGALTMCSALQVAGGGIGSLTVKVLLLSVVAITAKLTGEKKLK